MAHSVASLKLDTKAMAARAKVGTAVIRVIAWMPMPFSWKLSAAEWLATWVAKAPMKVSVD